MLWRLGLSAGPFTTQWLHKTEFSLLREDSKALRSRFVKALHACWLPCRRRHRRAADGWDHGEAVCKRYVVDSARFGIIRGWDGKQASRGRRRSRRPRHGSSASTGAALCGAVQTVRLLCSSSTSFTPLPPPSPVPPLLLLLHKPRKFLITAWTWTWCRPIAYLKKWHNISFHSYTTYLPSIIYIVHTTM